MLKNKTYKINESRTMSETLDDEAIIINLENGNYYSLNRTGTIIWNKLEANYSTGQIIQHFVNCFDENVNIIENSVLDLLGVLKKDELIFESEDSLVVEMEHFPLPKEKFEIPSIEKYEDMQEMLLADPIHDVQEIGWPALKTGT